MRPFGQFSLAYFVMCCAIGCAFVSAAWVNLDEAGKTVAREQLEVCLKALPGSKQNHHEINNKVGIISLKSARLNDQGNRKTTVVIFVAKIGPDNYDCEATILANYRRDVFDMTCENLEYHVEIAKNRVFL